MVKCKLKNLSPSRNDIQSASARNKTSLGTNHRRSRHWLHSRWTRRRHGHHESPVYHNLYCDVDVMLFASPWGQNLTWISKPFCLKLWKYICLSTKVIVSRMSLSLLVSFICTHVHVPFLADWNFMKFTWFNCVTYLRTLVLRIELCHPSSQPFVRILTFQVW